MVHKQFHYYFLNGIGHRARNRGKKMEWEGGIKIVHSNKMASAPDKMWEIDNGDTKGRSYASKGEQR